MRQHFVRLAAVVALLVTAGMGSASAQTPKYAYINSQRILAEAPGTSEAQDEFESSMEQYREQLESLEAELQTLQDNLERQQSTLTATVRQERQQEIQQKFMAYQQRRQELEQQAQQRQAQLVEPIMRRIQTVIEQIRTEGNYSMIFDGAAGAIITADPALDLTDEVLQRLAANP